MKTNRKIIRPPVLQSNSSIAIIAPSAGLISKSRLERGINVLQTHGLKPRVFGVAAKETKGIAGSPEERVRDLHAAFSDPEIKAIFTLYGGYNSNELLPLIDWELIRNNPKILCGYSDTTALLLAINKCTNIVTFHGPAILPEFGEPLGVNNFTEKGLFNVLKGFKDNYNLVSAQKWHDEFRPWNSKDEFKQPLYKKGGWKWLNQGNAKGILIGGHLRTIEAMIGTKYLPSFNNKIVFLEDLELSYQEFRRTVAHIQQTSIFDSISGLILGRLGRVLPETAIAMENWIKEKIAENIPVLANVDIGHTDPMLTLPVGTYAQLSSNKHEFSLIECPVKSI